MKWTFPALAILAVTASAQATAISAQDVTLTMWANGNCAPETCVDRALIAAFEANNPGIKIDYIEQPPDGYYTALLTASAIGTGPDLATMWAGGYMTEYKQYMVNVHDYVPRELIEQANGSAYFSEGYSNQNVTYAVPLTAQWYIGYYNKAIFAEHGITEVPTTWDELIAVSEKLQAAGVQPIINGAEGGSAQFQSLFEWAYLLTELPLADWAKLMDGSLPYNNPVIVEQLDRWHGLYQEGLMNEDAFNYPGAVDDFKAGRAAMLLSGGSWQIKELSDALGDDLGIMIPPYSSDPQNTLVSLAGGGYTAMNYSDNLEAAGKFLAFTLSDEGQQIIAQYDAPTRPGFATDSAQMNQLLTMTGSGDYTIYPMFDNFSQPPVTDAIYRNSALVLVGQMPATEAMDAVDGAFNSLPEDQKTSFTFGN